MLEKIGKPEIVLEDQRSDGKYGKFVLERLARGYGTTLGNSLRRVLLSSIPGVAYTTSFLRSRALRRMSPRSS